MLGGESTIIEYFWIPRNAGKLVLTGILQKKNPRQTHDSKIGDKKFSANFTNQILYIIANFEQDIEH